MPPLRFDREKAEGEKQRRKQPLEKAKGSIRKKAKNESNPHSKSARSEGKARKKTNAKNGGRSEKAIKDFFKIGNIRQQSKGIRASSSIPMFLINYYYFCYLRVCHYVFIWNMVANLLKFSIMNGS